MYKHKQEILFGMLKTILTIQLKEEEISSKSIIKECQDLWNKAKIEDNKCYYGGLGAGR